MKRSLLLAVVMLMLLAPPAGAVQLVNPDGSVAQPYQAWADASRVPLVSETVVVKNDALICAEFVACATPAVDTNSCPSYATCVVWPDSQTHATVWLTDPARMPVSPKIMLHELGHLYDHSMPEWKRQVFRRIVRLPNLPWRIEQPHTAPSLSEIWAEVYAECAVLRRAQDVLLSEVTTADRSHWLIARHLRRVCRLIRQPN